MQNRSDKQLAMCLWVLGMLMAAFVLSACSKYRNNLQYDTNCNRPELQKLRDKKLVLLSFENDNEIFKSAELLDQPTTATVADYQKEKYLEAFGSIFNVVDFTSDASKITGQELTLDKSELIQNILEDADAVGGIIVTNSYGYWITESGEDEIVKQILPEDMAKAFSLTYGEPFIMPEHHYLVSNIIIVNEQGAVIWNFHGKTSMRPDVVELPFLEGVERDSRRMVGMDPSQEEIVRYMEFTIDNYVDYVLWLIRMDFEGSGNKNYYADYLKGDKNAPVDIYPAMEEIAPWLREPTKETTITKEKKPSAIVELWDTARAGDWRKFGQWPQAKAAGILWLGSLLAFGILFSTYSLIGNIYEIESCVGKLFETFIGLAMLCVFVATYLLLQAIF